MLGQNPRVSWLAPGGDVCSLGIWGQILFPHTCSLFAEGLSDPPAQSSFLFKRVKGLGLRIYVAPLVEESPGINGAGFGHQPHKPCTVVNGCNPSPRRQEDEKFRVILSYITSLRQSKLDETQLRERDRQACTHTRAHTHNGGVKVFINLSQW